MHCALKSILHIMLKLKVDCTCFWRREVNESFGEKERKERFQHPWWQLSVCVPNSDKNIWINLFIISLLSIFNEWRIVKVSVCYAGIQHTVNYGRCLRRFYQTTICRRHFAESYFIAEQTCHEQVTQHGYLCGKFGFLISQGSVATFLRWGGYYSMGFLVNFTDFPAI